MLNKLQAVVNKYEELCFKSEQADFYTDPKKAAKLLREKMTWNPLLKRSRLISRRSRIWWTRKN